MGYWGVLTSPRGKDPGRSSGRPGIGVGECPVGNTSCGFCFPHCDKFTNQPDQQINSPDLRRIGVLDLCELLSFLL